MATRRLPSTTALIALGALAAHQLRYALAYGGEAGHELSAQGHGYLAQVVPVLGVYALAAVFAALVGAALRGRAVVGSQGFRRRAACFAAATFLVFALQELAEGALSAGHPAGLDAVFGAGGWLALPLAALAGVLCALLDRGLARLERAAASLLAGRPRFASPVGTRRPRQVPPVPSASPLALGIASRPPPLLAR